MAIGQNYSGWAVAALVAKSFQRLSPVSRGPRTSVTSLFSWTSISIALVWVVLIPRMVPRVWSDRGIFVSVAERLLAGDILYRDVWDNKDPLFYLSIAAGRAISPFADVLMEVGWMLCAGVAVMMVGRWLGCSIPVAGFVSFGLTPLILAGRLYVAGATHLPGIAITLLILAATTRRRYAIAGGLLAGLLLLKIIMVPVALIFVAIHVASHRKWRPVGSVALSFAVCLGLLLTFLQVRGELGPYIQSLLLNVSYSQGSVAVSDWGPIVGHLRRVISGGAICVLAAIVFVLVCQLMVGREGKWVRLVGRPLILWASIAGSLLGALAVLGVTGVWVHHGQILYVSAILAALAAAHSVQDHLGSRGLSTRSALTLVALACLGLMLSGMGPHMYLKSLANAPAALSSLASTAPETEAILSIAKSGTYARVGSNDDAGHAKGLGNWQLACPRFHQYPFESEQTLTAVSDCLTTADVVVVTPSAVRVPGNSVWNAYIDKVESLLRADYTCTSSQALRICARSTPWRG